jgi:hypothetical protein
MSVPNKSAMHEAIDDRNEELRLFKSAYDSKRVSDREGFIMAKYDELGLGTRTFSVQDLIENPLINFVASQAAFYSNTARTKNRILDTQREAIRICRVTYVPIILDKFNNNLRDLDTGRVTYMGERITTPAIELTQAELEQFKQFIKDCVFELYKYFGKKVFPQEDPIRIKADEYLLNTLRRDIIVKTVTGRTRGGIGIMRAAPEIILNAVYSAPRLPEGVNNKFLESIYALDYSETPILTREEAHRLAYSNDSSIVRRAGAGGPSNSTAIAATSSNSRAEGPSNSTTSSSAAANNTASIVARIAEKAAMEREEAAEKREKAAKDLYIMTHGSIEGYTQESAMQALLAKEANDARNNSELGGGKRKTYRKRHSTKHRKTKHRKTKHRKTKHRRTHRNKRQ